MKRKVNVMKWGFVLSLLSYPLLAETDFQLNQGEIQDSTAEINDFTRIDPRQNRRLARQFKPLDPYSGGLPKITFQVGPSFMYGRPSHISKVARDGAVVEIEAAEYLDDVAVWKQNNITLRGVGGRAHLRSRGKTIEGKAIWVIKGNNVVIENMEFSGAQVPSKNGAGIRLEGKNLTLRHCYFHNNEMGLITARNPKSEIIIENSEFANNTVNYQRDKKLGHNIYIGEVAKFTLTGSYIHDAETGHNVKSRAHENYILYNRITDEKSASSYLLDLPNGGDAFVVGNIFHQKSIAENKTLLSFAAERNQKLTNASLYVVNNTFVNSAKDAVFIDNHSAGLAQLLNNLFVGPGSISKGNAEQRHNIQLLSADFVNQERYDYRLKSAMSTVVNQGVTPELAKNGFILTPAYQYLHPAKIEPRAVNGAIDIGAYEFLP